jgi:hypothetical protein
MAATFAPAATAGIPIGPVRNNSSFRPVRVLHRSSRRSPWTLYEESTGSKGAPNTSDTSRSAARNCSASTPLCLDPSHPPSSTSVTETGTG